MSENKVKGAETIGRNSENWILGPMQGEKQQERMNEQQMGEEIKRAVQNKNRVFFLKQHLSQQTIVSAQCLCMR